LGLEMVMTGKIRGETVRFEDWDQREVGSVASLRTIFNLTDFVFRAQTVERNTLRIGVVIFSPKDNSEKRELR